MVAWEDKCCNCKHSSFPSFPCSLLITMSCVSEYPFGQFRSATPATSLQSLIFPRILTGEEEEKRKCWNGFTLGHCQHFCSHKFKTQHHSTTENPTPTHSQKKSARWCWPILFANMETIVHCKALPMMSPFKVAALRLLTWEGKPGLPEWGGDKDCAYQYALHIFCFLLVNVFHMSYSQLKWYIW